MAKDRVDVLVLLRKEASEADLDFLREGLRVVMQAVMEAEVVNKTGAGLGERSPERLTHGDITLAPGLRWQIEDWIGYPLPTEQREEAYPSSADTKYEEVVASLREATRDMTKFPLVFAENANYGFRRNLWGLRPIGAPIAVGLALVLWILLSLTIWGRPWPDPWWDVFVNPDSVVVIRIAVAAVETILAAFWMFWVKPSWVKAVADTYATRLMESVQTLRGN